MFTTWQRTVIRLKSIWWFRGKQNTSPSKQQFQNNLWFLQIWDVLVDATNNDHSGRTAFGLSLGGAIGGNTALSALVGGRLPCMSERVRTITQRPSGTDFNVGSGRSGSTTVIFISEASSGETGDSRQTLTTPIFNIRNCILHHITVAKEKLQTKRGTVLVRFHGTLSLTARAKWWHQWTKICAKGAIEHHPFSIGIFHEINHPFLLGYPHDYGNPHIEASGYAKLSLAGHPRSATPDATLALGAGAACTGELAASPVARFPCASAGHELSNFQKPQWLQYYFDSIGILKCYSTKSWKPIKVYWLRFTSIATQRY